MDALLSYLGDIIKKNSVTKLEFDVKRKQHPVPVAVGNQLSQTPSQLENLV
jgi:hypothetical protein